MVDWPLTFNCNNNCLSCIYDTRQTHKMGNPFMWQIKNVIDSIKDENMSLCLTGGEPTLRKEMFDILKYARQKHPNIYIFLVTNARMFSSKEFTRKLAELNLNNFMIGVALYGYNSEIHDTITKSSGSFNETKQGIKNLLKNDVRVELRIIVNKINYKYMNQLARFIVKEFKEVTRVVFINMKYTGNAFINRRKIFIKISESNPYVEKATDILLKNDVDVKLFHFPPCTIKKKYWNLAKGVTKQTVELMFVKRCKDCILKDECPMIWKSYHILYGDSEFKPILS